MKIKYSLALVFALVGTSFGGLWPWSRSFDLPALAKVARPATLQVVVSDSAGDQIATGTAFLIASDGIAVTNGHVIANATRVVLKNENGQTYSVQGVLDYSAANDLVLLKINGDRLPALQFGTSSKLEVGQHVAVIGSPLGLEGTVSDGVVSAMRKSETGPGWIQITAAISPGSSGSPVLNAEGLVIGIATMRLRDGQALNFAIPIEAVKALSLKGELSSLEEAALLLRDGSVMNDPSYKVLSKAFHADDWESASRALEELINRHPEWAFGYSELGFVLHMLGRNEQAVDAGKRAIDLNPNDSESWATVGLALRELRKNTDAIAAFKQAAKLNPQSFEAWNNLCDLYLDVGDKTNAAAAFQQMKKINGNPAPSKQRRTKTGF